MAQKGSKRAPKRSILPPKSSKVDTNGPKLHQTTLKPPKKRSCRLINPHNGYFRHSRTMDTLLEPFGGPSAAPQHPSGTTSFPKSHSFTLWEAPKGHWKGQKKALQAFFGPSKAPIVSYSRPRKVKIGQNGSKRCPNGSNYSQNGPKWEQHRLKRRQRGQNTVKVGSQGS